MTHPAKMVLGLGNNVDYEMAWDTEGMGRLAAEYGIKDAELRMDGSIESERDLLVSLLAFAKNGLGGERYVASPAAIEALAGRFGKKITLGGTGVRAALAMHTLGFGAALHLVTLNDHVRRLLPPGSPFVCSAEEEHVYPHGIIQYPKGARIAAGDIDFVTQRHNRLIYTHDPDNAGMRLAPELGDLLAQAEVLLISGFNAMRDGALLARRLDTLLGLMERLPREAVVFFEDAGYHEAALSELVREALLSRIDIYSLNEDELQHYLSRQVDLLDAGDVAAALKALHAIIPAKALVLHTRWWALAHGEGAEKLAPALEGGIAMATTRFRLGDGFASADYDATMALPPEAEGAAFAKAIAAELGEAVCCRPSVQAEVDRPTTIGLGDAFVGGFLPLLLADS